LDDAELAKACRHHVRVFLVAPGSPELVVGDLGQIMCPAASPVSFSREAQLRLLIGHYKAQR
jgi:hypothetical protein